MTLRRFGVAALLVIAGCGGEEIREPVELDSRTRLQRAQAALDEEREWAALWHWTRILRDDPEHPEALERLAYLTHAQGRWDDVATYLERLAAVRSLGAGERHVLARNCIRLNRFAAAESLLADIEQDQPPNPNAFAARGDARRSQGKLEAAAADYRRALELDPGFQLFARLALAEVLIDRNRAAEAEEVLANVTTATSGDPARLHFVRGHAALRQGDAGKAADELERCVELEPDHVQALHLLMMTRRELGDLEGARAAADRHREALAARSQASVMLAVQALVQGAIAIEAGDEAEALAAWEAGLREDPENLSLHCVLAPLYGKLDRRSDARASFTVLRAAMNGAVPGPLFLGTGKELRRRGLVRASVDQFEVAVARMPDSEEAAYFLALARSEAGDWGGAIEAAARFEALGP